MPKPTSVDQRVLINLVLGFVQNFLPDFAANHITYVRSNKSSRFAVLNVQCKSVPIATRVKSTFASIGTRVRISLMRAMSKRQKERDPNAVCSVSAFTSRPLLRVGGKDQGTRFLSFVNAVAGFRHLLTQEDLDRALSLCSNQKGRLKSKFLVLSDDRVLPPFQRKKKQPVPGSNPNFDQITQVPHQISQAPNLHHPPPVLHSQLPTTYMATSNQSQFPMLQFQAPSIASSLNGALIPGVVPIPPSAVPAVFSAANQLLPADASDYQLQSHDRDPLMISSPMTQLIGLQGAATQVQVHAQVHQAQVHQAQPALANPTFVSVGKSILVDPPYLQVGRKRGRKPTAPLGIKRQTPVRSAKNKEVKKPKAADPLNKSENMEDFASCSDGLESETDITNVTEVV